VPGCAQFLGQLISSIENRRQILQAAVVLERVKKNCGRSERGFLWFGEALAKEQVWKTL
jgi:hypothetical protein